MLRRSDAREWIEVPSHFRIGHIEICDLTRSFWRDRFNNLMKQIAVRIEEGTSLPCADVLLEHYAQQVRLSRSSFSDDVEMGTAVPLAYAKNGTAAAVIYAPYVRDSIVCTDWHPHRLRDAPMQLVDV
jgi:hypothetical protein